MSVEIRTRNIKYFLETCFPWIEKTNVREKKKLSVSLLLTGLVVGNHMKSSAQPGTCPDIPHETSCKHGLGEKTADSTAGLEAMDGKEVPAPP